MFSFYLYSFILIFSTMLVWLSEHAKNNINSKFFLTLSFLIVFLPSAIRYGVGTDFFSYYDIYNYQDWVNKNEYGFHLINHVLRSFGLSAQWAMATYALIFTLVGYLSYPKKKVWIYHLLFLSMLLFFSFNGIRQAIAVVFTMLAIKYELQGRNIAFIVLLAVASTFHQSTLFLLPAILFSRLSLSSKVKEKIFPLFITGITLFIWLGPSVFGFVQKIATQLNLPYVRYFESNYFQTVNINTGYLVLTKILLTLALILNSSKIINLYEKNWNIVVYSGFFVLFYSLSSQSAAFGRLSYVYIPGVICFLYLFLSHMAKKSSIWFILMSLIFASYILPYVTTSFSTINNSSSDNSYQSVFGNKH